MMVWNLLAASATLAVVAGMASSANAQAASPEIAGGQEAPSVAAAPVESSANDIIVTAQRRDQRLQDVPISITALSSGELTRRGITSTHDIGQSVPGLLMTESGGYVQPFIRGVGSTVTNLGEPGSAATYIDGVYMPTVNGQLYDLANIESIQVLKGPQGTLFGRNANTGAIIITTRQPEFEPDLNVNVSFGNLYSVKVSAFATAGFGDKIAASIAGNYDLHEGWFINKNPANGMGSRAGDSKRYTFRGALLFLPTDDLKITLIGDVMDIDDASPIIIQPINGYQGYVPGALLPEGPYDYIGNENVGYLASQRGISGRIEWDLGAVELTSTTAFRHYEDHSVFYDSDTTPARLSAINNNDVGDNFTQEVLLTSNNPDSKLSWVIGGFYLRQDGELAPLTIRSGATTTNIAVQQVTEAIAGFADGTLTLGKFELTGGIRYSSETKTISGTLNGTPRLTDEDHTWNSWTPRAVIAFHPNDQAMIYGSYAAGFKSGAFNANALSPVPIDPETVDAFEAGFKLSPMPGLTFNGAAFYYITEDLQVQALNPDTNLIELRNAAKVISKGADLEVAYSPVDNLNLNLGISYLNAKFDSFPNAQVFLPVPGGDGRNASAIVDVTGKRNVRSPDWTINLAADYTFELANGGSIQPSANLYYSSRYYWTVDNRIAEPSHFVANASIAWNLPGDQFSVSLFARNLFDEVRFRNVSASAQADRRAADEPRLYGIRLSYKFR